MTDLIFDSSSIISLALNDLLEVLPGLKNGFKGEFLISKNIKKEIIDRPLKSKRFKFQAIKLASLVGNVLKLVNFKAEKKALHLKDIANSIFLANGNPLKIVDLGEMEGLAIAVMSKCSYVVDERTTRLLVENPENLKKLLERKFRAKVEVNKQNMEKFLGETRGVEIIRSSELMTIAYEKGIFDKYKTKYVTGNSSREILEGILWGLKLNGCSISRDEIQQILRLEHNKT